MLYRRNLPKKKGGCRKTKGDICVDEARRLACPTLVLYLLSGVLYYQR